MMLISPMTGQGLTADTPHSLKDLDGNRWPVIDAIPFLRIGREALVADVLARLDAEDRDGALVELLRDADDWWDEPPPPRAAVHDLIQRREQVSLREAMRMLGFGRVGDYFAHRWSDPTYLAGLGLIGTYWHAPSTGLELACGIGHYIDVLQKHGVAMVGIDVVFAKLWLARHFVTGSDADLICCDASAAWPVAGSTFDLVLCQDAFYFLEPKAEVLGRLRAAVARHGTLLVGHVHNRNASNHSAGSAVGIEQAEAWFPHGTAYNDGELTRAAAEGGAPKSRAWSDLRDVEAFAVAEGRRGDTFEALASARQTVRLNPLYRECQDGWTIAWPSERYEAEYAPLATYPVHLVHPELNPENIRRGVFVDLPERW